MKVSIGRKTIIFPHPVLIISTYNENGEPNMMSVSWGGICASDPPSIAISVRKSRYTYKNLMATENYVVNIPSQDLLPHADYAGIYTGKEENKFDSTGLTPVKYDRLNVPYIEEFPINLICKVTQKIELGSHTQFIGEILDVLCSEEYIGRNKLPDIEKVKPFFFEQPGRSYYSIGEQIGKAFSTDKDDFTIKKK